MQIEVLGLRDMQTSALLGLLAMRRPKIAFEIGGVQAMLNVAPSFAANGNFNFGDEYLPMLRYSVSDNFQQPVVIRFSPRQGIIVPIECQRCLLLCFV